MPRYVVLLRGVNVGAHNRVAMADLRALLEGLGYGDVRTHLQSGNAVASAAAKSAAAVAATVEKALADTLSMPVPVLVRTARELADVVAADPFRKRAVDASRYVVVFCDQKVRPSLVDDLDPAAYVPEEVAVQGREIYLWLPGGMQNSPLVKAVTDQALAGTWTMRNWRTVTRLAEMAAAVPAGDRPDRRHGSG